MGRKREEVKQGINRVRRTFRNSIQTRIQLTMSGCVGLAVLIVTVVSSALNYTSTLDTLEQTMREAAVLSADRLNMELKATENVVFELGCTARLTSDEYSEEEKQEIINQKVKNYGMERGKLIGLDGICAYDGTDYTDREYFKQSLQGKTFISDPIPSKTTGELSVIISAPVWEGGIPNTKVVGVVFLVPNPNFLNNIVADVKISENAGCYIINNQGTTVAHSNAEMALSQNNTIENAKTDSKLNAIADLEKKMTAGEKGYGIYSYQGQRKLLAFAPIEGTNGWSVGINAPLNDFVSSTVVGIIICVVILVISLIAGGYIAVVIGRNIGVPITRAAERLQLLAQGDLHSDIPSVNSQDETKTLMDATKTIVESLKTVVGDTDYLLGQMADGNFDIRTSAESYYIGDFEGQLISMRKLNMRLSETLRNIKDAAGQVSSGSSQMAGNAQGLAEGATEQAGAVQELQATIANVTAMVEKSAENSKGDYNKAKSCEEEAVESAREMSQLTEAMERINEASKQIGNIIGEIEDIASQTNLLSLNASIEAARAGEAGKGFAVVANQISKLADDSARSAVTTKELIITSIKEIEKGNQITGRTSESLQKVVDGMEELAKSALETAEAAGGQTEAMRQIEQGIEQISGVVQSNSAAAEETSATSEELAAQAATLNELTAQFKLRND